MSKIDFDNFDFFGAFEQSLDEAIAFKNGDKTKARVTVMEIPMPKYKAADVARIRNSLRLTQKGLATVVGVSPRTVEAWEIGKSMPNGSATRMLYLIEHDNAIIDRLVSPRP
ncbi:hypothetical protein FACS1894191_6680 [Clostridia bacterium]|nr:hypothetical protein FACS1894191_6680 [Clostridia bacterium]